MADKSGPERPWILVTNDDGPESPALLPLLRELSALGVVRGLVPAEERSWSSKTMSRFQRLEMSEVAVEEERLSFNTVNGSPADCANLGIFSLWPSPPCLVVSGVNMGANSGLSFLLSSGTVGAAMEGVLGGIPALASSVQLEARDYRRWAQRSELEALSGICRQAALVTAEIAAEVLDGGLPEGASMLSINMPPEVTVDTPRRFARVTPTTYGAFFRRTEAGHFVHELGELKVDADDGDMAAIERGEVAITPLCFDLGVTPQRHDCQRFERIRSGPMSAADGNPERA